MRWRRSITFTSLGEQEPKLNLPLGAYAPTHYVVGFPVRTMSLDLL
jgi:hypothetical protein